MRPYTMDLRERVAAAVDDGRWSQRQIARLFRVSVSFVSRLLKSAARDRHPGPRAAPRRAPPGAQHRREVPALGPGRGAQRLHPGRAQAGRRLRLLPDDDLARPAAARPDPQEEVDARRRAATAPTSSGSGGRSGGGCGGSSPGGCNSSTSRGRTRRWPGPTPGRRAASGPSARPPGSGNRSR